MPSPVIEPELWRRLEAFDLDVADTALPFSRRLANENGWSHAFARRAIDEYRRFVFLAMVCEHPVTPSDEVDQVWHLHLCYTRSYWDELCGQVLPRPLHHGPTRGGGDERAKFDDWYRRTLASYERVFGEPPPASWWPAPAVRFAPRRWRRVDLAGTVPVRRGLLVAAATVPLLLVAASCSAGKAALALGAIGSILIVPAAIYFVLVRHEHRGSDRSGCGDAGGGYGGCGGGGRDDGGGDAGCGGGGCGGGCGD